MAETGKILGEDQNALDERVASLLAAHRGDAIAVIETLLLVADSRAARTSFGFVRGRLPPLPGEV